MTKPPYVSQFESMRTGIHTIRDITEKDEFSLRHLETLIVILQNSGKLNAKHIAEIVRMPQTAASKTLKSLEVHYGFITATVGDDDRRYKFYYATPLGKKFALDWLKPDSAAVLAIPTMAPQKARKIIE